MGNSMRMVVAEAPGKEENAALEPLVGMAGKWAQNLYKKAGINWADLTLFNVLPVQPPDNVFPLSSDARSYITEEAAREVIEHSIEYHLKPLMESRPWTRFDALGNWALEALTGKKGIYTWRGSPLALKGETAIKVMPTLHPAAIAREQVMSVVAVNDLKKSLVVPPEYYNLQPTLDDVLAFNATEFAFDLEFNMGTSQITMCGLCARPFHAIVVPFSGPYIQVLKHIFANAKRVIGHNVIQCDLPMLDVAGVRISDNCAVTDTMLVQHLLCPDLPHDLEFVASQFSNKPAWKDEERGTSHYWPLRCARDSDATLQSHRVLWPMLKLEKLDHLYEHCQVPLARICKLMHDTGIKRDPERLKTVRAKFIEEIKTAERLLPAELQTRMVPIRKRVKAPAGTVGKGGKPVKYVFEPAEKQVVPWNSDDVLKQYLYGTLNLPVQLHVKKKKPTVDKTAIEKLIRYCKREDKPEEAAVLKALQSLSKASTLVSSFLKAPKGHAAVAVSREHADFNVHGTAPGRLSSARPNMQNQPETARYIYVPSHADWCWVQADYSGAENLLTAYFANDTERLMRLRTPGFSEHKHNASIFFGVPYDEVVKSSDPDSYYKRAKIITHGLDKGEGPKRIAETNDFDFGEVRNLVALWKQHNFKTVEWQQRVGKEAEQQGWLSNPFGRKRWFWTSSLYTEALAQPAQSTVADVIYRAMIGLMYERIDWPLDRVLQVVRVAEPLPWPAQLVLQVHDSLLVETPRALVDQVVETMRRVMQQPWPELGGMSIPVEFECSEPGASWGECHKWSPLSLAA